MQISLTFDTSDPIDRADLIKIRLRDSDLTATQIAEELNISKAFVGDVINSRRASARVRQFIADHINQSVDTLWPPRRGRVLKM